MTEANEFDPAAILRALAEAGVDYVLIGGIAATLHGSPHVTFDVDIVPDRRRENLEALARVLEAIDARIRTAGVPEGLPFDRSPELLERVEILNLTTRFGDLDLTFVPSGTSGYEDLAANAEDLAIEGVPIAVASLADIIRSKEAAGREKDRVTLPALRRLLALRGEVDGDDRPEGSRDRGA